MKKHTCSVIAFVLVLFITFPLFSLDEETRASVGYLGGVNFSFLLGDGVDEMDEDLSALEPSNNIYGGFCAGLYYDFYLSSLLDLQIETMYSRKGRRYTYNSGTGGDKEYTFLYRFEYLEVPVMLKFKLPVSMPLGVNIIAGVNYSYMFNARQITKDNEEGKEISSAWLWESAKHNDVGITLGAGIEKELGVGRLLFDVRYTLNIMDFSEGKDDKMLTEGSLRQSGLKVLIGYGLP